MKNSFSTLLDAQLAVATRERQLAGLSAMHGDVDIPVTEREATFAQEVISLSNQVSDLKFEIACLRGTLPPLAREPTSLEIGLASKATGDIEKDVASYYGYWGARYHAFLGSVDSLESQALAGDKNAVRIMAAKCNARGREAFRLRAERLGINIVNEQDPDLILRLAITGSVYHSIFADVSPLVEKASTGDVMALSSLGTRCRMRATAIMREISELKKSIEREPIPETDGLRMQP